MKFSSTKIKILTRDGDRPDEIVIEVQGHVDPVFNNLELDAYQTNQLLSLLKWSYQTKK